MLKQLSFQAPLHRGVPGRRGSVPGQPLHQARQPAAGPGVQGHPGQAGEDREILIYTLLPLFFIEHFWSHKIFSFVKEVKKSEC